MLTRSIPAAAVLALLSASCGGGSGAVGASEQDINDALEAELRSAAGDWSAISTGASNALRLEFRLQESASGQLSGTGTMKEANAAAAVPITVTGSYQRPVLTLVFDGMVYESRQLQGKLQGSYTTVGGVGTTLMLTGPDSARQIAVLLQEK